MRPYEFKFIGRNGTAENEYLIDLDKLAVIGKPVFDTGDGIAYLALTFQGVHSELNMRFLTDYACTDPSVSTDDRRPMAEREKIMEDTQVSFLQAVERLKLAWIGSVV